MLHDILTNGFSCPLLSIILVGFYYLGLTPLLCCRFVSVFLVTASFALMNNAPSSASAAEDITALMIVDTVRIAPLLGGNLSSFDKKKCPPAQLRDFFLFAYPASL